MSSSGTPARGNYHAKTLGEKVEILREVDAGKANKVEIAKKHATPRSTLSTYVRNRKTIEDAYEAEVFAHGRKRLRSAKHPDLEKALITWVKEMRSQDLPLSGPIIMAKAAEFALHLKHHDFAASEGWFHRFRQRHDLVFRIVSGEVSWVRRRLAACDTGECEVVFEGMRDLLLDASFADYVDADSSAVICGAMTDEDIIAQVVGEPVAEAENDVDNEEEEVEVEEAPIRPSAPEVMDALNVARLFFSFEEGEEDALRLHLSEQLNLNMSALEYMMTSFPEVKEKEEMRKIIGRYGLTGRQQICPIRQLSDGQRCRVVFAWLAWQVPHLLLLDEPTNHLDMETIDALAEAIAEFDGGMVLVSHDFRLISQVAEEIWVCEKQTVTKWKGNILSYKEHLRKKVMASAEKPK
ncbi:hypothetical protein HPB47_027107 [Ixodes persulcatus]|uniref:Uncharacterized protein n=1 Tax=Ixodes persulcatus TaxID=34615 RepID=A0AC60PWR6_IXOPE|nr:hypothetical protein HPB47_027107 [Ixodes persulcatus]